MNTRGSTLPLAALAAVTGALALMFLYAPTEGLQGEVQRIFYIHVPAAWISFLAFFVVAVASVLLLSKRDLRYDRIAAAAAEAGLVFTTIMMTTGPIWGRRVWGVWWVWDARLTSSLVLWLIYVGYLLFRTTTPPGQRGARLSAVIGIVGAVNVPVVYFSVFWWRTLHPLPTVLNPEGQLLPAEMRVTLYLSLLAFLLVFASFVVLRLRIEDTRVRLTALEEALRA